MTIYLSEREARYIAGLDKKIILERQRLAALEEMYGQAVSDFLAMIIDERGEGRTKFDFAGDRRSLVAVEEKE